MTRATVAKLSARVIRVTSAQEQVLPIRKSRLWAEGSEKTAIDHGDVEGVGRQRLLADPGYQDRPLPFFLL